GNFRPILGKLAVSSIGIGTYLGENDEATDREYEEALKAALLGGINLIDTAVNYRLQRSERCIGRVLKELADSGKIRREEIVIASKGGYITFDGEVPADPRAYLRETYIEPGIITPGDLVEGSHCMTPRYLDKMLAMSLENLGLETIDIYYLHNPETQLGAVSRDEFLSRIRTAFEFLESAAKSNKIGVYGAATWNGFRVDANDPSWMSLSELWRIARDVGGADHHFRALQMPYNLAMPEALTAVNQPAPSGEGEGSPLFAARSLEIAVFASASLLQGQLTRGLPPIIAEACAGLSSDAQRAVQFVRSTPGVDVALVGMKSAAHVEQILATARREPAPFESLMKLFKRVDQP
ncbi:MAG: aldo/keto reductase, partial [Candidatus Binataceae bacterium]